MVDTTTTPARDRRTKAQLLEELAQTAAALLEERDIRMRNEARMIDTRDTFASLRGKIEAEARDLRQCLADIRLAVRTHVAVRHPSCADQFQDSRSASMYGSALLTTGESENVEELRILEFIYKLSSCAKAPR